MRVAFWRDGEGPSQRASHYRPMSPLPAGRPKRLSGCRMTYCHYRLLRFLRHFGGADDAPLLPRLRITKPSTPARPAFITNELISDRNLSREVSYASDVRRDLLHGRSHPSLSSGRATVHLHDRRRLDRLDQRPEQFQSTLRS